MHATDLSLAMVLALGAIHGVNPAMGWLFAVSLGLQERRSGAVWGALGPLALGHALAIAVAVGAAAALGLVVSPRALRIVAAAALLAFGIFHFARHRHPRWGGMRIGPRDLTIWSFLMASAHGAGLMILPFILGSSSAASHASTMGAGHEVLAAGGLSAESAAIAATVVHTAGYLLVTGVIAVVVYEKVGLRFLRRAWINVNAIWAGALVVTAVLTLVV